MPEWIDQERATAQFGTMKAATARKRRPPKKARQSQAGNVKLRKRF